MLPKKITWKNIKTRWDILKKTSKIVDFVYDNPPIIVMWQALRVDKVSKIILKVVQDDFDNNFKKLF